MSIGKKILGGFSVALVFLMITGALAYRSTNKLIDTNDWVTHTHKVIEHLETLLSLMKDEETGQRGYLLTNQSNFLDPYNVARKEIVPARQRLEELMDEEARKEPTKIAEKRKNIEDLDASIAERSDYTVMTIELGKIDKIDNPVKALESATTGIKGARAKEFIDLFRERIKDAKTGFEAAKLIESSEKGKLLMDAVRKKVSEIRAKEENSLKARQVEARDSAHATMITIGVATVLAVVFVAVGGYFITRSIVQPLQKLLDGTEKIAQGTLTFRVNLQGKDELADLARAFDRMTEKRQQAHDAMREAAAQITAAGAEILASTTEQAAGAQEQASAVTQTVATVDEVTQTADQAAQRAKSVGESVQRTLDIGKAGRKTVEDSLDAMSTVKEKVEATAENILLLAEQAQAIGDIIATVNDVAEQTNLLALNAAIEAARAGEHGQGFAVVAGEVKALADQSKKATAQVRQILGEIQKATNTSVLSTEEVTKGVAAAMKLGTQADDTIKALADTLTDTARAVTQIAASVGQQATGMTQIHQAMKSIDQVAKQNTVATRQAAQAAENLNALGTKLSALTTL